MPVPVISEPGNGTQKFLLLRAEPTGLDAAGESMRRAAARGSRGRDHGRELRKLVAAGPGAEQRFGRLSKRYKPSVLPTPCATPRVVSGT
jgi:hypothetical protein